MNAFARPGLAEEKLPPVSSADNGKVLGVNNGVWEKVAASGGTTVVANPTLAGTEADLTGLQVGDTKYKVPAGGGGGVLIVTDTNGTLDKTWQEIYDAGFAVYRLSGVPIVITLNQIGIDGSTYYVVFEAGGDITTFETESASGYPIFANHDSGGDNGGISHT